MTIEAADMVLISKGRAEAGKVPSRSAWLCQAIFEAQPEINAIALSCPPSMMGYAISHVKFDPRVIPESYLLLRELPTLDYGTQFDNLPELTKTLSPRYPVVLLENDCMLSTGANPLQAFDRMEVAEYSAKATLSASLFGGLKPMNAAQTQGIIDAFHLLP